MDRKLDRAFFKRFAANLLVAALFLCAYGAAIAQTPQPWDTNILTFVHDATTCTTGEPASACPVTGIRVERAPASGGPFTTLASPVSSPFTHSSVAAGVNCYRVVALSAQGESAPSNVLCKTNVRPAGPPNPPRLLTVGVVADLNHAPVYRMTAAGARDLRYRDACGFVPVGVECQVERQTSFRGFSLHLIDPSGVKAYGGVDCSGRVAAPCS